jgi:hypothetical protein
MLQPHMVFSKKCDQCYNKDVPLLIWESLKRLDDSIASHL